MAKHKYIETPEKMWELFQAYKKEAKNKPFLQHDFVGKDGEPVYREKERCLSMEGFECYCLENESDVHNYFDNADNRYDEYKTICSRIKKEIRKDQIEGGMAGVYNPSITQRLNGLKEQSETKTENIHRVIQIESVSSSVPLSNGEGQVLLD